MTTWHRFRHWLLARQIRSVERRLLDQVRERGLIDDIIAYHRGRIAELEKLKAVLR